MSLPADYDADDIILSLTEPRPQRRWTIALRLILAIPHLLFASLLAQVVQFAVVLMWFAALFTGRVPLGIAEFVARVVQYSTGVYAYAQYLMTDVYPPWNLTAREPYPVETEIALPGPLNRAAVLFRAVLMVPATIVAAVVNSGLTAAIFVVWLITLISGRMPTALYEAHAAILRYTVRWIGYISLLTSDYPRGLFGDRHPPADVELEPPPIGPEGPRIRRLVLSAAARRIIVLYLVLGVFFLGGVITVSVISANLADEALEDVVDWYDDVSADFATYFTDIQVCARSAERQCAIAAMRELREDINQAIVDLEAIDMPASALEEADRVRDDLVRMADALARLETAPDAEFAPLTQELGAAGSDFDKDYIDLYNAVLFA